MTATHLLIAYSSYFPTLPGCTRDALVLNKITKEDWPTCSPRAAPRRRKIKPFVAASNVSGSITAMIGPVIVQGRAV